MEDIVLNHLAVLAAAFSLLIIGGIWYSPILFYNVWKKENGLTDKDLSNGNPAKIYGIALILSFLWRIILHFLGDNNTDLAWGASAGFLTGFGFSGLIFAVVALFELRSWKYIFINGGFITVSYTVMGLIIGAWR